MRTNILISKTGTFLNEDQNQLIAASSINGNASYSLFLNQITLEFFDAVIESTNGLITPDNTSVVREGLSGTVQFSAWSSANSPYPITLTTDTIDVSTDCMLQWTGITQALEIVCTGISGANYINVLIDRN